MTRVYFADLTHDAQTVANNAFPLGVASIASFTKRELRGEVEVSVFKYAGDLADAIVTAPPAVIGFSNYLWNFELAYAFAQRVKRRFPETVTVLGGPNYPTEPAEQEAFLRAVPDVDFYIYKEGERAFADLVRRLLETGMDIEAVKAEDPGSCHFLRDGKLVAGPLAERIRDLDEIPSPYTTGLMDKFFDGRLMPLVQTNRGCPFSCTFCVEGLGYYNKVHTAGTDRVGAELEYIASRITGTRDLFIADSNFGMYKDDLATAEQIASVMERYDWPQYIHVATGKNQKERVLKVAQTIHGAMRLSASVQSLDDDVLDNIKRKNISADQIVELAREGNAIGSNTYSEIILCLPGDTREKHLRTIKTVVDGGLNFVRLFTLMMLPGTEMASEESRERFAMETRYRILPRCFGEYAFDGERFHVAEIEEVCVATETMPLDDYVACREFDLSVEMLYNDGIFREIHELVKLLGGSTFDWLEYVHDRRERLSEACSALYRDFAAETRSELWESKEALAAFFGETGVYDHYLDGEYGSNLIFKYKTAAFFHHLRELHDGVFELTAEFLASRGDAPAWLGEYLDDLRAFSLARKGDCLTAHGEIVQSFRYDFRKLEEAGFAVEPLRSTEPIALVFRHTRAQIENIVNHVNQYGTTEVGLARILSKIHVLKMYRGVAYAGDGMEEDSSAPDVLAISPGTYQ